MTNPPRDFCVADPQTGHFTQADSIIPEPGKASAFDRYAYVLNNPIRYNDPSGHRDSGECGPGEDCDRKKRPSSWEEYQKQKKNKSGGKNEEIYLTLIDRVGEGDVLAFVDLLIPSHVGGRIQAEGSVDIGIGLSMSIGANVVFNRNSDKLVANIDWSVEPGIGIGVGASGTGGFLIGWGSSTTDDVTKGTSGIISGTAADSAAISIAVSAPLEDDFIDSILNTHGTSMKNSGRKSEFLHVDSNSGIVPFTAFWGEGIGAAYAGVGGGVNGQTGLNADLSKYLPWQW